MSRSAPSVVVPGITATRLPETSVSRLIFASVKVRRLPPSRKVSTLKSTWAMRPRVLVVEPHSMSTVPLFTALMRSSGVTLRLGIGLGHEGEGRGGLAIPDGEHARPLDAGEGVFRLLRDGGGGRAEEQGAEQRSQRRGQQSWHGGLLTRAGRS